MSIWIRSQNQKIITECNTFRIESYTLDETKRYLITNDIMQGYPLASYSTEEKAMKVLDMIQNCIDENEEFYAQGGYSNGCRLRKFVFQMPQEEKKNESNND